MLNFLKTHFKMNPNDTELTSNITTQNFKVQWPLEATEKNKGMI